jgi:hypothetical protein
MERLTPAGLSFLTPHMMLEQELRKALHGGSNRLVIIGSPELIVTNLSSTDEGV